MTTAEQIIVGAIVPYNCNPHWEARILSVSESGRVTLRGYNKRANVPSWTHNQTMRETLTSLNRK